MLAANPNEVSISHKEWCQDEMVVTRMDHTSQPYKCQKIPQEKCSNMNSFAKGNRSTFQKHRANNCCVQVDTRKHARDFHCTEERAGRGKCEDAIGKFCVPYPEKFVTKNQIIHLIIQKNLFLFFIWLFRLF